MIGVCMGNIFRPRAFLTDLYRTAEPQGVLSIQTTEYQNPNPCQ